MYKEKRKAIKREEGAGDFTKSSTNNYTFFEENNQHIKSCIYIYKYEKFNY